MSTDNIINTSVSPVAIVVMEERNVFSERMRNLGIVLIGGYFFLAIIIVCLAVRWWPVHFPRDTVVVLAMQFLFLVLSWVGILFSSIISHKKHLQIEILELNCNITSGLSTVMMKHLQTAKRTVSTTWERLSHQEQIVSRQEQPIMRHRSMSRRRRQQHWSTSSQRLMAVCLSVILLHSPPQPRQRNTFLTILPVAHAAEEVRHQQEQPTKELDKQQHKVSSNQLLRMNDDSSKNRPLTLNQLLLKAGKKGLGGGIPGFIAGIFQVLSLMWLRTIINYQCRYGTTFREALVTLRNEGGIARFYRGVWFALVQAPLSRFASTASNDGVETLLAGLKATKDWGPARTTVVASIVVGFIRILLMPVDTCKTVLQVDSVEGFKSLVRRVKAGKIGVLFQGSLAMALSSAMAHYPWFYTFNLLNNSSFVHSVVSNKLLRNAGIGVVASFVSDTIVNSVRVIKTMKQSMGSKHAVSYFETIRMVLAADGWTGLFGRGLRTRLYANALQSLVFTVIWRGLTEHWRKKSEGTSTADRDLRERD